MTDSPKYDQISVAIDSAEYD